MFQDRYIHTHKVEPTETLHVRRADDLGADGANHRYEVIGANFGDNPSYNPYTDLDPTQPFVVLFQNGPIRDAGVNGVTQEALAAIIIDRLESFQEGPFASDHSATALAHFRAGLESLQQHTRDRLLRGVEGTDTL